mgnify:CR=1 FL=1
MKLVVLSVLALIGFAARAAWTVAARRRLAAIDRGEICVGCGSKQMRVSNDRACCDACGEERDLAALRAHQISSSELDAMMKPQGKQGFWD